MDCALACVRWTKARRWHPPRPTRFPPGFGRTPHSLVGRDDLLADLGGGLTAGPRDPRYASLLMGVRGSGKTVVLNELEDRAARQGWVVLSVDGSSKGLPERIVNAVANARADSPAVGTATESQRGSRLQSVGLRLGVLSATWQAGDRLQQRPHSTMGDVLATLTQAAVHAETSVLLTVDELHAVDREEARRLCSDIQHIAGRAGLPLAFVGAGLLEMGYTLLADNKIAFMQRCERHEMHPLSQADVAVGLRLPIRDAGGDITSEALQTAVSFVGESRHGPYRLQVLGHTMWRMAGAPDRTIDTRAVELSLRVAETAVARSICTPAWHELSDSAQSYLAAVAVAPGHTPPSELAQKVAERTGLSVRHTADIRRRLVLAGYLTQRADGTVTLTDLVPNDVMRQEAPEEFRHYEAGSTTHDQTTVAEAEAEAANSSCRKWMPRARAHCVLPNGHGGRCRSRL